MADDHPTESLDERPRQPGDALARNERGQFQPGATLAERYRIVSVLGRGGMGEVYRADDLTLGQSVALKVLPTALAADTVRLERFRAEVRLTRQVSHPNVCRVYDIGDADGVHFLTMEYIDGEDLASLLKRIGRLPGEKAVEIARQICAGLAAAHEQGVIHRDLKPANIMIDGRGKARVTDFGVASLSDAGVATGEWAGTPAYMAPEQFDGEPATVRSDIYSLGLVLYELFTGKRVYDANSIAELKSLRTSAATPVSPASVVQDIDPAAESAILRCLEPEPADRLPNAASVIAALPGGDPLRAMLDAGETPSPDLVAASGRSGAITRLTGLLLALVAIAGIGFGRYMQAQDPVHQLAGTLLPPDAMQYRAQEMLRDLGYTEAPVDIARGYSVRALAGDQDLSRPELRIALTDETAGRFSFWYRQHTERMVPVRSTLPGGLGGEKVTRDDPANIVPGMVGLQLGAQGRLLWFEAVTGPFDAGGSAERPATDWPAVLEAAGFDDFVLEPRAPSFLPQTGWDERAAWIGAHPEFDWRPIRIEAAAINGRMTAFVVTAADAPNTTMPLGGSPVGGAGNNIAMTMIGLVIGGSLALYNIRLGRWDRRGSVRLGVFCFGVSMLGWLIMTSHSSNVLLEAYLLISGLSYALARSAIACILYIGLEPFIRKVFPESLVGWSRLLAGRWTDPRIGRDVLAALGLLGVFGVIANLIQISLGGAFTHDLNQLLNTRDVMSHLARTPVVSLGAALTFVTCAVLVIVAAPNRRGLAPIIVWMFMFTFISLTADEAPELPQRLAVAVFGSTGFTFMIFRLGLLSMVLVFTAGDWLNLTLVALDPGVWIAPPMLLMSGMLAALIVFGFVTSTAGQPWRRAATTPQLD